MAYDWTAGTLRCRATDAEGYPCILLPSHGGGHRWSRCEAVDVAGYRCMLPPHHPGDHELAWFARPTAPGATRTITYRSTSEAAPPQAERDARVLAAHDWYPVSRTYVPGSWGLEDLLLLLARVPRPTGRLMVEYEYRPGSSRPAAGLPLG